MMSMNSRSRSLGHKECSKSMSRTISMQSVLQIILTTISKGTGPNET